MLSCTFNFHELKATFPALLLDGYLAYYISQKTLDSEYRCGLLYTNILHIYYSDVILSVLLWTLRWKKTTLFELPQKLKVNQEQQNLMFMSRRVSKERSKGTGFQKSIIFRQRFLVLVDIGGYFIDQNSSGMITYISSQKTPPGKQTVRLWFALNINSNMRPPLTVIQKIKALNDKLDVCLNSFDFGLSN